MRKNSNSGQFLDRTQLPGAPENLKRHGRALWAKIQSEYQILDSGGLEMLAQACAAADRAEECATRVKADGLILVSGSGTSHDHPLIRHELAARAFVVKTLKSLGLHVEPLKRGPGRPPADAPVPYGISIDGEEDEWDSPTTN
jgi:P27 family predicted phage terminase small subunit